MRYLVVLSLTVTLLCSCKTWTCQCVDKTTHLGTRDFEIDTRNDGEAQAECEAAADSTEECFLSE